jgi:hypothetical protein
VDGECFASSKVSAPFRGTSIVTVAIKTMALSGNNFFERLSNR